jgi:hypothetical protein
LFFGHQRRGDDNRQPIGFKGIKESATTGARVNPQDESVSEIELSRQVA